MNRDTSGIFVLNFQWQKVEMSDSEKLYQVAKILHKKELRGKILYKIRWLGFSSRDDTWEPPENLVGCQELIDDYEASQAIPPSKQRRQSRRKRTISPEASSDEEVDKGQRPARKTKQASKEAEKILASTPNKEVRKPQLTQPPEVKSTGLFTASYELRSAKGSQMFSSDEDSAVAGSSPLKRSAIPARMTLTESRLRKHLSKHTSVTVTSKAQRSFKVTQVAEASPPVSNRVKTRLQFGTSERKPTRPIATNTWNTIKTTTSQEPVATRSTTSKEPAVTTTSEQPAVQPPVVQPPVDDLEQAQDWLQIGWAEFGMAAFVTAAAAFGYFCWTSDYC